MATRPNAPRQGANRNYAGKPAVAPKRKGKPIKVVATKTGYYDHARRREGDVFVIDENDFSDAHRTDKALPGWMERVPANTPESVSTSQDEINRQHDEILAAKAAKPVGADEPGL